jgi:uncharacterized membrane protein
VARLELAAGLVLTLLVAGLHVTFLTHAGALWRDEVQILNLSTAPTFAEQWRLNEHDTFPLLWQLTLRAWKAAGLAESDAGIRVLGFLVGLAIVGMLWYCARQFEAGSPLVSLAIFGISPTVLLYGDSVRGYGFGTLWLLFMIARLWRVVRQPTNRNMVWAGIAVVLAVQSFYFSVVFFAAFWFFLMGMFLSRRAWRPAVALTGIGVIAAASMLPYVSILRRQLRWHSFLETDVSVWLLTGRFKDAVNATGKVSLWIWLALLALVVGGCLAQLRRPGPRVDRDRMLFVVWMLVTGPTIYLLFLLWRSQPTHLWYYIGLMAFLAAALDAGLHYLVVNSWRGRLTRLSLLVVISIAFMVRAWPAAHTRMTNVDQVAMTLAEKADKDDLILINPWWPGVTFTRYYNGQTPWTTLPDLGPLPVQRFDLFRDKLFETEPIKPVLDRVSQTLRSGRRVWIVGELAYLKKGESPGEIPPAPTGPLQEAPWLAVWSRQAAHLIQSHATRTEIVPVPADQPVNRFEQLGLMVVEGWL